MTLRDAPPQTPTPQSSPEPRGDGTTDQEGPRRRRRVTVAVVGNAVLIAVVTVLTASVAYRTRLLTTNIDGLSMMSIARQYAEGDVADAVNGYWSPLVSWLMAPVIAAGAELTSAYMVVNVATVVAILVLSAALVLHGTRSGWLAAWVNATTGALLLANVTRQTPDLLVVLWFLLFVWALVVADRAWDGTRRAMVAAGVALGAACAFGYVAKLYTVPVFLGVLAVWLALRWGRRGVLRRPRQLLLPGVAVGTLVLLAAPWVVALSVKYDGPTIGSSFGVNIASKFDSSAAAPTDGDYVVPTPPNDSAVSPAEDRTPAVYDGNTLSAPRTNGSSADTGIDDPTEDVDAAVDTGIVDALGYYVSERVAAFPFYLTRIASFAAFAAPIGVVFAAAAVAGVVRFRDHPAAVLVAVGTGVYALGYAGITSASSGGGNARYYYPVLVGTLLMAAALLPRVWRRLDPGRWVRRSLVVLACLTVVTASWTQNVLGQAAPFTTVGSGAGGAPAFDVLGPTATSDDDTLIDALDAADAIPAGSRIIGDNARETVSIAWRTGAQAYGKSEQQYDWQDPSFVALLQDAEIDLFLHFADAGSPQPDYTAAGTLRASVEALSTCSHDSSGGEPVPCRIDVVDIAG